MPHLTHPGHDLVGETGFWRPAVIARKCFLWLDREVERESGGAVLCSHAAALHRCATCLSGADVRLQHCCCCCMWLAASLVKRCCLRFCMCAKGAQGVPAVACCAGACCRPRSPAAAGDWRTAAGPATRCPCQGHALLSCLEVPPHQRLPATLPPPAPMPAAAPPGVRSYFLSAAIRL